MHAVLHEVAHRAVWRPMIKRAIAAWMLAVGIGAASAALLCATTGTARAAAPAAGASASASASASTNAGAGAGAGTGASTLSNAPTDSAPFNVDTLMHAFAQRKSGEASFTELKYLSNLKGPVESSGTLAFRAPDHFEQQTLKPRPQSVVVDGDTVTMSRGNSQRVVSLAQYPEIAMLVNSIRGTLTGDRSSLERVYTLTLAGDPGSWHLTLTPSDPALAKNVDHIVVSGGAGSEHVAQIHTIETFQADGDRSVMTIETGAP
jgi:outer membrane lipoprotein-sorting protein